MSISLSSANEIIAGAHSYAEAKGYPPMAFVVMDEAGNVCSAQRQDGATMFRIDIAAGKAWAAVAMGAPTRELARRAIELPVFFTSLTSVSAGRFLPQTGAVLIKNVSGVTLGAVGASGGTSDQDEEAAAAGVKGAGLVPS